MDKFTCVFVLKEIADQINARGIVFEALDQAIRAVKVYDGNSARDPAAVWNKAGRREAFFVMLEELGIDANARAYNALKKNYGVVGTPGELLAEVSDPEDLRQFMTRKGKDLSHCGDTTVKFIVDCCENYLRRITYETA